MVSIVCWVWELADGLFLVASGRDGDSNAKTSLAYIQLEKQNERLKEALIRCVIFVVFLHRILHDLCAEIAFATCRRRQNKNSAAA